MCGMNTWKWLGARHHHAQFPSCTSFYYVLFVSLTCPQPVCPSDSSGLKMWSLSRSPRTASTKCGSGATLCSSWSNSSCTACWPPCWPCPSPSSSGWCSRCSAASTSGRKRCPPQPAALCVLLLVEPALSDTAPSLTVKGDQGFLQENTKHHIGLEQWRIWGFSKSGWH